MQEESAKKLFLRRICHKCDRIATSSTKQVSAPNGIAIHDFRAQQLAPASAHPYQVSICRM
ncbi:hypothetical protein [uncultured Gimesia sp.]|uniref:hypothetical protein n=1 Tax=uncultured Gimesia sp. TaxID=1678688 RepID=UPI0026033270|nr:hypothetical protein [uncultured Gimesia sp.]